MIQQIKSVILAGCLVAWGAAVQAQGSFCAPFSLANAVSEVNAAAPSAGERALLQDGLRAVLDDDNSLLRDDIVGPVTVASLSDLCTEVPQVSGTDPIAGTVDLAVNYGRIAAFNDGWRLGLAAGTLLDDSGASYNRRVVRLGAGAAMSAAALAGTAIGDNATCAALVSQPPDLIGSDLFMIQSALAAIASADPTLSASDAMMSEQTFGPASQVAAQDVCLLYPAVGGVDGLLASLRQIGSLSALRPDALSVLGGREFAAFLGDDFVPRSIRLLGTAPAVVELVNEFDRPAGAVANTDVASAPAEQSDGSADACPRPAGVANVDYFSLSADEIEGLKARSDVGAALQPLLEVKYPSLQDLEVAVSTKLGVGAGSCAEYRLRAIVARNQADTEVYGLDSQKTVDLKLQPSLSAVVPVLESLVDAEAGTLDTLKEGVKSQVAEAAGASEREKIVAAAEVAAQAAEEEVPQPDALAEGFPTGEAAVPIPEFLLTDESITVIAAQITDPEFVEAIRNTPTYAVSSREMVSTLALEQLAPIAEARAAKATEDTMTQIDDAGIITLQYRLAPSIVSDLKKAPEFAAVSVLPLDQLDQLSGVAYPFRRLMDDAAELLPVDPATQSAGETEADLRAANVEAVAGAAHKFVDADSRLVAPFAADCGCSAPRPANSLVYGFYPFWLADPDPRYSTLPEPPEPGTEEAGDAEEIAARVESIDYELFGRVAYDGLVIGSDGEVVNRRFWDAAGPNFVVSAHKYQSKADVAIRLRDWRSWDPDKINEVADNILELLAPQPFPEKTESSLAIGRMLDRLFSRTPDGVTLVVEQYRDVIEDEQRNGGVEKSYKLGNLIQLVKALHGRLEDGNAQIQINLAFDISLSGNGQSAANLFRDLEAANILRGSDNPKVGNVLVFLERETTETKKILRERIEQAFSGNARIQVLRSVLPIVPPGGHELIYTARQPDVKFSQFEDDVFYFQDNFGGMGFWPILPYTVDATSEPEVGVRSIVMERFSEQGLARAAAAGESVNSGSLQNGYKAATAWSSEKLAPVCGWSCPRRLVGYFLMAVTVVCIATLTWLMLYSSFWNRWGRRLFLVPILVLILLLLLILTQACDDPPLNWAIGAFMLVLALVLFAQIYSRYQTKLDGPLP